MLLFYTHTCIYINTYIYIYVHILWIYIYIYIYICVVWVSLCIIKYGYKPKTLSERILKWGTVKGRERTVRSGGVKKIWWEKRKEGRGH